MAEILFRPVCSKCRRELNSIIDYHPVNFRGFDDGFVEPGRCPHCDALFTSIEIPPRLPFDNTLNIRMKEKQMKTTKDECDKDYAEKKLELSDEKCKACEFYYKCKYIFWSYEDVVYGE